MRQDPRAAQVEDVADRAVPLHLELIAAQLEAAVQLVEVLLRLRDVPREAWGGVAGLLLRDEVRELQVLAVDQLPERDLHVLADDLVLAGAEFGDLGEERIEGSVDELQLDALAVRQVQHRREMR